MSYTYLISYDLHKSRKNYDKLYNYIKSFPQWAHIFESIWLVKSSKEYTTISNEIKCTVYPEDQVFVSKLQL